MRTVPDILAYVDSLLTYVLVSARSIFTLRYLYAYTVYASTKEIDKLFLGWGKGVIQFLRYTLRSLRWRPIFYQANPPFPTMNRQPTEKNKGRDPNDNKHQTNMIAFLRAQRRCFCIQFLYIWYEMFVSNHGFGYVGMCKNKFTSQEMSHGS